MRLDRSRLEGWPAAVARTGDTPHTWVYRQFGFTKGSPSDSSFESFAWFCLLAGPCRERHWSCWKPAEVCPMAVESIGSGVWLNSRWQLRATPAPGSAPIALSVRAGAPNSALSNRNCCRSQSQTPYLMLSLRWAELFYGWCLLTQVCGCPHPHTTLMLMPTFLGL